MPILFATVYILESNCLLDFYINDYHNHFFNKIVHFKVLPQDMCSSVKTGSSNPAILDKLYLEGYPEGLS